METMGHDKEEKVNCMLIAIKQNEKCPGENVSVSKEVWKTNLRSAHGNSNSAQLSVPVSVAKPQCANF